MRRRGGPGRQLLPAAPAPSHRHGRARPHHGQRRVCPDRPHPACHLPGYRPGRRPGGHPQRRPGASAQAPHRPSNGPYPAPGHCGPSPRQVRRRPGWPRTCRPGRAAPGRAARTPRAPPRGPRPGPGDAWRGTPGHRNGCRYGVSTPRRWRGHRPPRGENGRSALPRPCRTRCRGSRSRAHPHDARRRPENRAHLGHPSGGPRRTDPTTGDRRPGGHPPAPGGSYVPPRPRRRRQRPLRR
ncbi:hypothetical protein SNS2_1538 [Streptomyces netropsis]|nr:hypothetical protein SNS2_1538 [Streptomyces netropsis]